MKQLKDKGLKIMKYGGASNMHGRGRFRNFDTKYPEEIIHLEDIYADRRTQTQYTIEK